MATRKSALALAQARSFASDLMRVAPGLRVRELHVTTSGDRIQDRGLSQIGGKGLFIKEVEHALVAGDAAFAVHSMKDVPAELMTGLCIAAVPVREDPRDVIITREGCRFTELPRGSRVGTSSLRRAVQLLDMRPDLVILPLRGNVDTRLRRCMEGVVDAVVLARAGLLRLGAATEGAELLAPELCLPAVGQGALGIECRQGDEWMLEVLSKLDDAETHVAVSAERGVMLAVDGSCQVPVAAYARREGRDIVLSGMLARPDGAELRRRVRRAPWPEAIVEAHEIGVDLGRELKSG